MSPLMAVLIGVVAVIFATIIILGIAARWLTEPANSPRQFLRRGRLPGTRQVIVCAGDSITHGLVSADYVAMLRSQFAAQGCEIVNAGINGHLAWNLAQRLPDIIACKPDVVTVLIGTNDVNATFSQQAEDQYRRVQKLPQKPTLDWYRQTVEQIIDALQAGTQARIAILTLPPLGEDLSSDINRRVVQYNDALRDIAQRKGVTLLPLHDRLRALIPADHTPPVYGTRGDLMNAAILRHYVLRQSWDAIAADHGFIVLTDHIHLNDRAAGIIAELVAGFMGQA